MQKLRVLPYVKVFVSILYIMQMLQFHLAVSLCIIPLFSLYDLILLIMNNFEQLSVKR